MVEESDREALLMRGVLDMCVLALLDAEPQHAYGLVQQLQSQDFPNVSYGTMYPLVTRLRRQGLVEQHVQPSPSGPARNILTITSQGQAMLRAWTSQWELTNRRATALLRRRPIEPRPRHA
jgi:PadR family transcriptional regulator PadR